jgi:hypothetical protein
VAVWATESEFNQFTDWPTFTITGFGEYNPFLIVTVSRFGGFTHSGFVGVGVHGAVGLDVLVMLDELPHPIANNASKITAPTVDRLALESLKTMFQTSATSVPSPSWKQPLTAQLRFALASAPAGRLDQCAKKDSRSTPLSCVRWNSEGGALEP